MSWTCRSLMFRRYQAKGKALYSASRSPKAHVYFTRTPFSLPYTCRQSAIWKVISQRSSNRYQRHSNDNSFRVIPIFVAKFRSAVLSKPRLCPGVPTLSWVVFILPFASSITAVFRNWNSDTKCETIHAIRDMNAGEEIPISYDKGGPSDSRSTHLKDAFGFNCNCSVCSLPLPPISKSVTLAAPKSNI